MKTSELELPEYLYTEETGPGGTPTRLIAPDKLVSWAEQGHGDAIARLCHSVYERKLASINVWERERILQLEDERRAAGGEAGMSDCRYQNVRHYHTTCEAVVREAEMKRAGAREQMNEHQTAVEKLVQEARVFILDYVAHQDEDNMLVYLLVIVAAIAIGFSLFN